MLAVRVLGSKVSSRRPICWLTKSGFAPARISSTFVMFQSHTENTVPKAWGSLGSAGPLKRSSTGDGEFGCHTTLPRICGTRCAVSMSEQCYTKHLHAGESTSSMLHALALGHARTAFTRANLLHASRSEPCVHPSMCSSTSHVMFAGA